MYTHMLDDCIIVSDRMKEFKHFFTHDINRLFLFINQQLQHLHVQYIFMQQTMKDEISLAVVSYYGIASFAVIVM